MTQVLRIVRAEPTYENIKIILRLIDQAKDWLSTKSTAQWSEPWPTKAQRDHRILRGLEAGTTWIIWAGKAAAATVTIATKPNSAVWSGSMCDLGESAVYAHRLIVDRRFAGRGLGAELIDWAGLRGNHQYGAKWIRIDVWSDNKALHKYYMKTGFERCGQCPDPCYPAGALFQKPVPAMGELGTLQFAEDDLSVAHGAVTNLMPRAVTRAHFVFEAVRRRRGG
jgi:ribosomal protein S18 acetylase RimI-like enzyme